MLARPLARSSTVVCFVLTLVSTLEAGGINRFGSFDFDFRLESPLIPGLNETSAITGAPGERVPFTIGLDLGAGAGAIAGVQGWSVGVWTAGFEIDSVTVDGTAAAPRSLGGAFDQESGFLAFQIIDPEDNEGRTGVVQGCVLSFIDSATLPPGHRYLIGKVRCRALVGESARAAFARYENGLIGRGQPVWNALTVEGSTARVAIGHRDIAIGADADAELCDDGVDNDGDGWTDAGDPDCMAPRPREDCENGEDDDEDGATDCDDSECQFRPPCPPTEICGDGRDNDRDGDADCNDSDCEGHPFCIAREDCDDGVDNDNDGLVDCDDRDCNGIGPCPVIERCLSSEDDDEDGFLNCDDSDCLGSVFCGAIESCADGEDNNGDGRTDCEDPQCRDGPQCVETEDCDDGIDNDRDGRVDCDDSQCRGVGDCPGPERCGDGRDNDRDGDVDCDDSNCALDPLCVDPEICDDGIDNDRDGRVDCDDSQCRGRGSCPGPEDCFDGDDNDLDGDVDCDDSECRALAHCRSERCDNGIDDDIDGLIDCDDPTCAGRGDCGTELCDNGVDDDEDGLVDCDDPGCSVRSPCGEGANGFDLVLVADGVVREIREPEGGGAGKPRPAGMPTNVLDVPASAALIEVTTYIVPVPVPQTTGIQGWSLSIAHDVDALDIIGAPTIEGTDAGEIFSGGFEKTETAGQDSADGDGVGAGDESGDSGVISAVVLSFTQPSILDPSIAQSVLRTTYELEGAGGIGTPAVVRFRDGLRGSGSPVANVLTIEGATRRPVHLIPLEIRREGSPFVRGDINSDGKIDIADAVWALNDLMGGGPPTQCLSAADVNDDGSFDIADAVYVVHYQFLHGPTIPAPFPGCGVDADEGTLPCPYGTAPACAG